jgi:hypothetical protein
MTSEMSVSAAVVADVVSGEAPADQAPEGPAAAHTEGAAAPGADPWADLLQAGAAMLQGLAAQRQPGAAPAVRIERDPQTGQASLRLPLPDPALLQQLAKALEPWLKR